MDNQNLEIVLFNGIKISIDVKNEYQNAQFAEFCNQFPRDWCWTHSKEMMIKLYTYDTLKRLIGDLVQNIDVDKMRAQRALEDEPRQRVNNIATSTLGKEVASIYNEYIYDARTKDECPCKVNDNLNHLTYYVKVDWQELKKALVSKYGIKLKKPFDKQRMTVVEGFLQVLSSVKEALVSQFLLSNMPHAQKEYDSQCVSSLIKAVNERFDLDLKDWQVLDTSAKHISKVALYDKLFEVTTTKLEYKY